MSATKEILIVGWHPRTLNKATGKRAAFALRDEKLKLERKINEAKLRNGWTDATKPCTVQIELGKTHSSALDQDNANFVKKVIHDALSQPKGRKKIGTSLIVDDSLEWLTSPDVQQVYNQPEKYTRIIIKENE